jgi:hypothetical protein
VRDVRLSLDGGKIQAVNAPKRLVALALAAVLLTSCGGRGVDGTKVEASLRDYLSTVDPKACLDSTFCNQGVFPVGAGVPRVREHSCKKVHTGPRRPARFPKGQPRPPRLPEGLTSWSCIVTFGKTGLPVAVAVKRNGDVYMANPVSQAPPLPPATVYEGGP